MIDFVVENVRLCSGMSVDVMSLAGLTPALVRWDGEPFVQWRSLGKRRFIEPFFEDTLRAALSDPELGQRTRTPIDALHALAESSPGVPLRGLVFHASRCGSTLVSTMLATLPSAVVISEAPPIDSMVRAPVSDEERVRLLRSMVGALGQKRVGTERVMFLKLDAWHIAQLPLFQRAFPGVPWVFVYRDPTEILVSHARQRGMHMVPGLLDPAALGLAGDHQVSLDEYGARVLGAILEAGRARGGLHVHHRDLPGAVVDRIAAHFGLQLSTMERDAMLAATRAHAKRPGETYSADGADKQREATDALRELAARFCDEPYRKLERGDLTDRVVETALAIDRRPTTFPTSLRLPLDFDPAPLRAELAQLEPLFVPHFNAGYYTGSWAGLALRAPGGVESKITANPDEAFADTPALARSPALQAVLRAFECPLESVRLLRLDAGSSILEHADHHLGFDDGVVRLHVPIVTDPDVDFIVDGVRTEMRAGECWYHDFARLHAVRNRSTKARVHLVIDCVLDDWMKALLERGQKS